jgi:hypothetical protein
MKDLRIFISYSHDDGGIATPLANLLQAAFAPVLTQAFVDKSSISFGTNIKESVEEALKRADILIAVIGVGQPASTLSWPAYEIGTFTALWQDDIYKQGPHKGRVKNDVIGQVFALLNVGRGRVSTGPLQGQRPVNLGISEEWLSDGGNTEILSKARSAASVENAELLEFLKSIEEQVKKESEYVQYAKGRTKSLSDLVRDFKIEVFDVLRDQVRDRSKPTKQLIVRTQSGRSSLADDARLTSIAGASDVFGKSEGDPRLFKKDDDGIPGSERYVATWAEFKAAVKDNQYGPYWCGVIEHAVISVTGAASELDPNLVFICNKGQRHRIVPTTITNYYNNDAEVSLYLIECMKRSDQGDPETSNLLNLLILICRFRFAFLEGTSPFYWRNFNSTGNPRELLMEIDYLKSEATNANLERPGAYEEFMTEEKLSEMMNIWSDVDLELRRACNAALTELTELNGGPLSAPLVSQIVTQLKRIFTDLKPFNTLLGQAVSERLMQVFDRDREKVASSGQPLLAAVS